MKLRGFTSCALLAFLSLLCLVTTASAKCYTVTNPMNPFDMEESDCPKPVDRDEIKSHLQSQSEPQDNMFDIDLTCNDESKRCKQVKASFEEAGAILSRTFLLKSRITVQALFDDFCKTGVVEKELCDRAGGAASPAQFLFVRDSDCVERIYPQALVKQFNLRNKPNFDKPDILAMFNSIFEYHFAGDDDPIRADQNDFTYVVLHELIHGMGFITTWRNYYVDEIVTPLPRSKNVDGGTQLVFVESAFDQHLFNTVRSIPYTNFTAKFNSFPAQKNVNSEVELFNSFIQSDQGKDAKEILNDFETANSTVFQTTVGDDQVVLETSLKPYRPSSSVAHVSLEVYMNTPDFLMAYTAIPGKTLEDIQKDVGGDSPIGPLTAHLMSSLGYATEDNRNPAQPDSSKCSESDSGDTFSGMDPTTGDGFSGDGTDADGKTADASRGVSIRGSLLVTLLLLGCLAINSFL